MLKSLWETPSDLATVQATGSEISEKCWPKRMSEPSNPIPGCPARLSRIAAHPVGLGSQPSSPRIGAGEHPAATSAEKRSLASHLSLGSGELLQMNPRMADSAQKRTQRDNKRKCPICARSFNKTEHLERHVRSHTKEKPFECQHCGRKYGRKYVGNLCA